MGDRASESELTIFSKPLTDHRINLLFSTRLDHGRELEEVIDALIREDHVTHCEKQLNNGSIGGSVEEVRLKIQRFGVLL
jgi:hypothetical protein